MTATATAASPQSNPDPLLYSLELPRAVRLFPMGHAVELSTNSCAVEAAARALWSEYPKLSEAAAVKVRIAVSDSETAGPFLPALPRGQEHLVSIVHGPDNFAAADLSAAFAFACLTKDVAADRHLVSWYFLEPLVCLLLAARHFAQVHAACISLGGRGVLLCGETGAGKTSLAYACARAGWTFVSGDVTQIVRNEAPARVIGRPYSIRFRDSARDLFPELRSPALRRYGARCSPNGKVDLEIDTADLGIAVNPEACASHIVFLNRVTDSQGASFSPMPHDMAIGQLQQVIVYGHDALRASQRKALRRLPELPVLRLTYSRLDDAEQMLRTLLERPI